MSCHARYGVFKDIADWWSAVRGIYGIPALQEEPRQILSSCLMQMGNVVIRDSTVVTMDRAETVIKNGSIVLEEDHILDVGKSDNLAKKYRTDITIDAKGKVVLPGFINVHTHLPSLFKRGVYGVLTGADNIHAMTAIKGELKPEYMYPYGLVSCSEAINFGCTTVLENYNYVSGFAKAAVESGLRAVIGEQFTEADWAKIGHAVYEYLPEQAEKGLDRGIRLVEEWDGKGDGRIGTIFAPQAPDLCTPWVYEKTAEVAAKYNKGITTHVAQTGEEVRQVKKLYGKTPIEYLHDLGVLGKKTSGAHLIYATETDLKIMKESASSILHCPRGYLFSGITAPLERWCELGLTVGLGSDDVFHSMSETMRTALIGAHVRAQNEKRQPTWPSHKQLLRLATIEGAKVLGLEKEIGSIEPGKKADLIIFNLQAQHMTPTMDPLSSIVLYGGASDIETVIIDGKIVKEKGRVLTVDTDKFQAETQRLTEEIYERFWRAHPTLYDAWLKQTRFN